MVMVEWGWEGSLGRDGALAAAERVLAARALAACPPRRRLARPLGALYNDIREYFFYGVGDLFYYVSADGKAAVRENVFKAISSEVERVSQDGGRGAGVSLTFVAHSAGTVIAYDFLYHLYDPRRRGFLGFGLDKIRRLIRRRRLRIRRFFTMGSPLAPFIFRADALIQKIGAGERLQLEHIGLRAADGLAGPRWVNFWDERDLFAYPVAFLFDEASRGTVEDKAIELGGLFPKVHRKYWASRGVADYAAAVW